MNLPFQIILGSASPRRKELLESIGLTFSVITKDVDERFPGDLDKREVAKYVARKKAMAYRLFSNELLITADTIVLLGDEILGKPKDNEHAFSMLSKLSNSTHSVITGVCLKTVSKEISFSEETKVDFRELRTSEIEYYIKNFEVLDKAGAYGIQDWIGKVGVKGIQGDYFNVVGLPVYKVYEKLNEL